MEDQGAGIELLRSTSFGRKRVVSLPCSSCIYFVDDLDKNKPLKRQCSFGRQSPLEDLPQEILIRILCGVEHEDLKQLLLISKTVKEATLIAKQWHFAYNTPSKTVNVKVDEEMAMWGEVEAPNAPKQSRVYRKPLTPRKRATISVALFATEMEMD